MATIETGIQISGIGIAVNVLLAITKITAGIFGNSYALVADGIESTADVVSSLIVWSGFRASLKPADHNHPFGHGKAESITGVVVALGLVAAALLIAVQSVREILAPHGLPRLFTIFVLLGVVVIKEVLYRFVLKIGHALDSTALKGDAWHHRSDALTSLAALIGISVALIGGHGYESADDWAALAACGLIAYNGVRLAGPALNEIMDATVEERLVAEVRKIALRTPHVGGIGKCYVRKSGLGILIDIHIKVAGELTVREGHDIAHAVESSLRTSPLRVVYVSVHIEPTAQVES